jgi:hypothetical protein
MSLSATQLRRNAPDFKSNSSYDVVLAMVLTTLHKCITSLFVVLNFTFSEETMSETDNMLVCLCLNIMIIVSVHAIVYCGGYKSGLPNNT